MKPFALLAASLASTGVIGPTPHAASLAATTRYAQHQVRAWNRPGVSYSIGSCRVLHRRPWLAWGCEWELHGAPQGECLERLILGVKRLPDGRYRAVALKDVEVVEC